MHGVVFNELETFVESEYGDSAWDEIVEQADPSSTMFLPTTSYPDEDMVALVDAATDKTGTGTPALLEAFGEFIGPELLDMYRAQVDDDWDALDLLVHTEEQIHNAVRSDMEHAEPPELDATRQSPDEVEILYTSDRELCPLAVGIIRSIGDHYGESLGVTQETCMLDGSDHCEIVVDR